jgi:hypothetical protein
LRTCRHIYAPVALGLILMLAPCVALSKGLFDGDTTHVIPYDEGDFDRVPSAAATISLIACEQTYKGAFFTLEFEVFESAWRPVYAIEIEVLNGASVEAIDWPSGWSPGVYPEAFDGPPGRLSFYTESSPIHPGSGLSGFTLLCSANRAVIRWYATEKNGIMLGKVTRTVFTCASGTIPETWGSIKAVYR